MASMEDAGMEVMEEQLDGNLNINDLRQAVEEAPVVKLVNLILAEAVKKGAVTSIRTLKDVSRPFRIDGVLYEVMTLRWPQERCISRLKIMADLDISNDVSPRMDA
jgi:type IV pilus assembly protein PilB